MDAFSSSEHSSDDEDPEGNNRPRTSRSAGMQPLSRNPAASVQLTAGGSRPAQPPVARAQAQVSNLGPTSQSQRNSEAARVAQLETVSLFHLCSSSFAVLTATRNRPFTRLRELFGTQRHERPHWA